MAILRIIGQIMNKLIVLGCIIAVMFGTNSCKKEVSPNLIITVRDTSNMAVAGAEVYTHPDWVWEPYKKNPILDSTRINDAFVKVGITNSSGQVEFAYPYSAVLDIVAFGYITSVDSSTGIIDSTEKWSGKTIAKFESKQLKEDEENNFNSTVILDLQNWTQ